MPELPEVEVVKKSLKKKIVNLLIKKVIINTNKLRYPITKKQFSKIVNKKILSIKRRSKYLIINLEKKITILVHLGMTGKFFIIENKIRQKTSFYYNLKSKDTKHTHLIFVLNKNIKLIYNDVRKFGFIKIIPTDTLALNSHINTLGPEPLSKNFNLNYFRNYAEGKKKNIKNIMMDQKFVSGLGNIYVNEILYLSKLNPRKSVKNIDDKTMTKLIYFTKKILIDSIKKGGSSIKDFNDTEGKTGSFQQKFNVYGRIGKKCIKSNCRGLITKTNISNRATFYCKSCQK
jgi:formamidopyrimidine-DNA glycosylase